LSRLEIPDHRRSAEDTVTLRKLSTILQSAAVRITSLILYNHSPSYYRKHVTVAIEGVVKYQTLTRKQSVSVNAV